MCSDRRDFEDEGADRGDRSIGHALRDAPRNKTMVGFSKPLQEDTSTLKFTKIKSSVKVPKKSQKSEAKQKSNQLKNFDSSAILNESSR